MEKEDSDDEFFTKRDKSEEEADRFEEYIDKNMEGDKKERVKGYPVSYTHLTLPTNSRV